MLISRHCSSLKVSKPLHLTMDDTECEKLNLFLQDAAETSVIIIKVQKTKLPKI